MSTDKWIDRLSEYLDGELEKRDREALEAHLPGCAECSAALDDLRAVVARAGSLDDRGPSRDLWSGIAERIGAGSGAAVEVRAIESAPWRREGLFGRRLSFSLPQLAAAAVALIVVSGAVAGGWVGMRAAGSRAAGPAPNPAEMTVATASSLGGARYDSAVVELEQALVANRGQLDTVTVRILEENLGIIDRAIDQARRALAADPGSVYLSSHLAATLKRKMDLLRRATALTTVQS